MEKFKRPENLIICLIYMAIHFYEGKPLYLTQLLSWFRIVCMLNYQIGFPYIILNMFPKSLLQHCKSTVNLHFSPVPNSIILRYFGNYSSSKFEIVVFLTSSFQITSIFSQYFFILNLRICLQCPSPRRDLDRFLNFF